MTELDQIDHEVVAEQRRSAAGIARKHLLKVLAARDRGFSLSQISAFIAKRAGCSEGTVKSALARALRDAPRGGKRTKGGSSKDRMAMRPAAPEAQPVRAPIAIGATATTTDARPAVAAVASVTPAPAQPAPTGIHALISGLSPSTALQSPPTVTVSSAPPAKPDAQRVA